jgi:hypothetical protein
MELDEAEVYGMVLKETEEVILVDFGHDEIWLPKSHVSDYPDVEESGEITMSYWLAMDKDLI